MRPVRSLSQRSRWRRLGLEQWVAVNGGEGKAEESEQWAREGMGRRRKGQGFQLLPPGAVMAERSQGGEPVEGKNSFIKPLCGRVQAALHLWKLNQRVGQKKKKRQSGRREPLR